MSAAQQEARARVIAMLKKSTSVEDFLKTLEAHTNPNYCKTIRGCIEHFKRILAGNHTVGLADVKDLVKDEDLSHIIHELLVPKQTEPFEKEPAPTEIDHNRTMGMSPEVMAAITRSQEARAVNPPPRPKVIGLLAAATSNLLRALATSVETGRESDPEATRISKILLETAEKIGEPR